MVNVFLFDSNAGLDSETPVRFPLELPDLDKWLLEYLFQRSAPK